MDPYGNWSSNVVRVGDYGFTGGAFAVKHATDPYSWSSNFVRVGDYGPAASDAFTMKSAADPYRGFAPNVFRVSDYGLTAGGALTAYPHSWSPSVVRVGDSGFTAGGAFTVKRAMDPYNWSSNFVRVGDYGLTAGGAFTVKGAANPYGNLATNLFRVGDYGLTVGGAFTAKSAADPYSGFSPNISRIGDSGLKAGGAFTPNYSMVNTKLPSAWMSISRPEPPASHYLMPTLSDGVVIGNASVSASATIRSALRADALRVSIGSAAPVRAEPVTRPQRISDFDVTLAARIASVDQALVEPYRGMCGATDRASDDFVRHASVSARALLTELLEVKAPGRSAKAWYRASGEPNRQLFTGKKPTWLGRVRFLFHIAGADAEFSGLLGTAAGRRILDIESTFEWLGENVHTVSRRVTPPEMRDATRRIAEVVRSLLTILGY